MGRKVQGTQFPAGVWGSAPSVHLKGENSMQYTAAMKQMPMQGLFSFSCSVVIFEKAAVLAAFFLHRWAIDGRATEVYNIQRYTHNIHTIFNLTVKGRVRRWQL